MPEQLSISQLADALDCEDYEVILGGEDNIGEEDEDNSLVDIILSYTHIW